MEGYQSKLKESAQKEKLKCFKNWYSMCCENSKDSRYYNRKFETPAKYERHDISNDSPDYSAI